MFLFRKGPFMSAGDKAIITIEGVGGHAARPHLTVDPVVVAASIVMALQTIVARNVDPSQPAVVTVGSMHAGTANNVISEQRETELSVRSFSPEIRALLKKRITELAENPGRELRRQGVRRLYRRLSGGRQLGCRNRFCGAGGA